MSAPAPQSALQRYGRSGWTGRLRYPAIALAALAHVLFLYALKNGLGARLEQALQPVLQVQLVQDAPAPPPPPPMPKIVARPEPVKTVAPAPAFIPMPEVPAPQAAPAPVPVSTEIPRKEYTITPAPVTAPAAPAHLAMALACPTQVKPLMPRRAQIMGIGGTVVAQARIVHGSITEVSILSGPEVFHDAVKKAMLQYQCVSSADTVLATQSFEFRAP